MTRHLPRAAMGLALGFALSFIGFGSFDEVHRMFLFSDLRLFLTFAGGVVLAGVGLAVIRRARPMPARGFHRGIVPGAAMFGAGWAICGACPGITLVQLGEGKILAVLTLGGLLAGNWAYGLILARYLQWDAASCSE